MVRLVQYCLIEPPAEVAELAWDLLVEGKTALVTGATSGIGLSVTRSLVEQGVRVGAVGRRREALDRLSSEGDGRSIVPLMADLAEPDQVMRMVREALATLGRVDILINDAGVGYRANVVDTTTEEWDTTFAIDVRAPFLAVHELIPAMIENGGGTIVNVASVGGLIAIADRAAYTSAKAALIALTRSIALDFARQGIRANCVAPGTTETPWIDRILAGAGDAADELRVQMRQRQIVDRLATPEEIADAIVFLASPRSAFMHGATLVIDGGYSIR